MVSKVSRGRTHQMRSQKFSRIPFSSTSTLSWSVQSSIRWAACCHRLNSHKLPTPPSLVTPTTRPPPSAFKAPPPADEVGCLRHHYLNQVNKKAPSATGQPKQFATMQANAKKAIHCNRPLEATDTIPVVLLHLANSLTI
jgi:hypothetical protein